MPEATCKNCGKKTDRKDLDLQWDKDGRMARCPHCNFKMKFHKLPTGMKMTPNGQLWREDRVREKR